MAVAAVNVPALVLWALALVVAWKSGDRVLRENRRWTRAWRIVVVCAFSLVFGSVFVPVGALWVLVTHGRPRHVRRARARAAV